jgi:hypothetical protein
MPWFIEAEMAASRKVDLLQLGAPNRLRSPVLEGRRTASQRPCLSPATAYALWSQAIERPEPLQRGHNVVRGQPRSGWLRGFSPIVAGQRILVPEAIVSLMVPQPGN